MRFERPLHSERKRRESQTAALQSGSTGWTEELPAVAGGKLAFAWQEATADLTARDFNAVVDRVERETLRWLGYPLSPSWIASPEARNGNGWLVSNDDRLSLIEAEHGALSELAENIAFDIAGFHAGSSLNLDRYTNTVNEILESHLVSFQVNSNSVLVPMQSQEMHREVVEPVLSLLRGDGRFNAAESAYQKALTELRNHDPGDAITDAGTALSGMFTALGCNGQALGEQLKSAKTTGLIRGTDAPLTELVSKWVAAQRNNGEAHHAIHDYGMSDAWMVVHVVGALMIRLSEFDAQRGGQA